MNNEKLLDGVLKGFVDAEYDALVEYQPRLLVNNNSNDEKIKVLNYIIRELKTCDEFIFSVAFITLDGIQGLKTTLLELENSGIRGTIIASQYNNFTEPRALKELLIFNNIELRIVPVSTTSAKMHTKGYIFKKKNEFSCIIGSSNLTANALTKNLEWNMYFHLAEKAALKSEFLVEYQNVYNASIEVNSAFLTEYEILYNQSRKINLACENRIEETIKIEPNLMQQIALNRLENFRRNNENKALVISATGTGKTYLAAFDVKNVCPAKMLFIVHRETIAKEALKSFKRLMEGSKKMTLLTGNSRSFEADYYFATIQTISRNEILTQFKSDYFDYIVIDEVHRAGAPTYQKVVDYFKPRFLLGMSATPQRSDSFDVYKLFDNNIACEIRLNEAMANELICPFNYFGVSEIIVDGESIDDFCNFNLLTSDERIKNIIAKANFYGYSGNKVKGLIFCSRKEEAKVLSSKFNLFGYKTCALDGDSSQDERESAIKKLESDDLPEFQ